MAIRPLSPFWKVRCAQVFSLKPAPFCKLFAGFCSTNKSAISLLLSDCRHLVFSSVFLFTSISDRFGSNCLLSPVLSDYNGSPDTRFSRGTTWLMSWPDGERYSCPLQFLVVSALLSLVSTLFLDWRHTVSSELFDAQVPSVFTEELVLTRRARCVLSLRCNGHSLLLSSYLSRISRIDSPCSAFGHSSLDTSHVILHCPATYSLRRSLFGDSLSLYHLWSRPWGVAQLLGLHVFRHVPIPRKGSGNNNNMVVSGVNYDSCPPQWPEGIPSLSSSFD